MVLKPFVDDSLEVAIAKHLLVAKDEAGEPREIRLEGGHSFVRSSKRMREVEAQAQLVAKVGYSRPDPGRERHWAKRLWRCIRTRCHAAPAKCS